QEKLRRPREDVAAIQHSLEAAETAQRRYTKAAADLAVQLARAEDEFKAGLRRDLQGALMQLTAEAQAEREAVSAALARAMIEHLPALALADQLVASCTGPLAESVLSRYGG